MTIFVNGRFSTQPLSGVQRYAGEIVRALDGWAGTAGAREIVLLSPPRAPPAGLAHIEQRWVGRTSGHRWEQGAFARAARDGVALSLAMSGPLLHPRQLVVLHDAAVHRHPEHFAWRYATAHRLLEQGLARRASIATVSEFSRRELAAVLGLAERKIVVAPNGADHARSRPEMAVIDRLGLRGKRFFVTVGNLTPNKNIALAVRALQRIDDCEARLVIVGEQRAALFGAVNLPADPRVVMAGRLSDAAVAALLGAARALVFPSRYEGFGLPLLEAMAAGCPVLASDCAAAVEVCDGAADHFGVDDDAALAWLMMRAMSDPTWRAARVAAGQARATQCRWSRSAQVLAEACAVMAPGLAQAA